MILVGLSFASLSNVLGFASLYKKKCNILAIRAGGSVFMKPYFTPISYHLVLFIVCGNKCKLEHSERNLRYKSEHVIFSGSGFLGAFGEGSG